VDPIQTLNDNSGAIVAVTASVSAVFTLLLLLDARATRNLRREANVAAHPRLHGEAGMLLELRVVNHGPANARDIEIAFRFTDENGKDLGGRRQAEPLLPVGEDRRFLPSPGDALVDLNDLAERRVSMSVSWSWSDDRRRAWFFPVRHLRQGKYAAEDLRTGLYGGWSLTRRDPIEDVHSIAAHLREIERALKRLHPDAERTARAIERIGDTRSTARTRSFIARRHPAVVEWLRRVALRLRRVIATR